MSPCCLYYQSSHAYLVHGIKCFVSLKLEGPHVTCHTCLSCLTYRSLKCKFDKSIALLMLELPLTCHCHDVRCGNLPYEHIGHTMPPLGISFFFKLCNMSFVSIYTLHFKCSRRSKACAWTYNSLTMQLWQLAP